jgi:hypothetical protein
MTMPSPVRFTLIAIIFLSLGTIVSFAQCKEINAEAKVVKRGSDAGANQSISVEIKHSNSSYELNLFGPHKNNILRSDKTEFNNLPSGKYLIVIVGKREEDNYCPKSITITVN